MYKVNVGGENFIIHLEGKKRRINLLKTYYLSAENQDLAEYQSLEKLKKELIDKVLNQLDDPPEMYIQSVEIVETIPKDNLSEFYWNEIGTIDADSNV